MASNKDSTSYILKIAIILSLVCATLVSIAAVGLRSTQEANAAKEKKRNILVAAGVYEKGAKVDALFDEFIVAEAIDLKSGQSTDAINISNFDELKAAKDPQTGQALSEDPAKIGFIANQAVIYKLVRDGKVERVILPVRGYGLWGIMYGFLAMNIDGKTIEGITFYDQKETPGLGAEIMNAEWQQTWSGKKPFDSEATPSLRLVKTMSTDPAVAEQQVDALAGATLTSRGVEEMINFWLGEQAYGPYLQQLAQ